MKFLPCFLVLFFAITAHARQEKAPHIPGQPGNFEMNIEASIKNVIRLAQDNQKNASFFTRELIRVLKEGEPVYAAPFPIPGFNATITKGRTDRKKGLTYWTWSTHFMDAPKGEKGAEIEALAARADSIAARYQPYLAPEKANAVSYIYVSRVVNKPYYESNYAALEISFAKPVYQTEQQVYDSLVSLYQPLLADPGAAKASASQFCYALVHEGFEESKAVPAIREMLPGIADSNINAAFAVCMGLPFFVKYDAVKDVLTYQQQEKLKTMAQAFINDWEEEWKRKYGKTDRVVVQQKKTETAKIQKACAGYASESNIQPGMLIKGLTVSGPAENKTFIGRLKEIDCTKGIVYITQPGVTERPYSSTTVQVSLSNYHRHWKKHGEQYYSCSRCGGAGGDYVTETESKTKELPFGYFEGIQTTITKTTTKTYMRYCSKCHGTGLALEKERTYE